MPILCNYRSGLRLNSIKTKFNFMNAFEGKLCKSVHRDSYLYYHCIKATKTHKREFLVTDQGGAVMQPRL